MKKTQPKKKAITRTALTALLEPAIMLVLDQQDIPFTIETTRRLVRSLASMSIRYLYLAGGSERAAVQQLMQALKIAKLEAQECQTFAATTQPLAKA